MCQQQQQHRTDDCRNGYYVGRRKHTDNEPERKLQRKGIIPGRITLVEQFPSRFVTARFVGRRGRKPPENLERSFSLRTTPPPPFESMWGSSGCANITPVAFAGSGVKGRQRKDWAEALAVVAKGDGTVSGGCQAQLRKRGLSCFSEPDTDDVLGQYFRCAPPSPSSALSLQGKVGEH